MKGREMKNMDFWTATGPPTDGSMSSWTQVTESSQWNFERAPAPGEVRHWKCKEMPNSKKHAKHTILDLPLFIVAKTKAKGSSGLGLEAETKFRCGPG